MNASSGTTGYLRLQSFTVGSQLAYTMNHVDINTGSANESVTDGLVNGATNQSLLTPPAGAIRKLKSFWLTNTGTIPASIQIDWVNSSAGLIVGMVPDTTLLVGESISWTQDAGWERLEPTGFLKTTTEHRGKQSGSLGSVHGMATAQTGVKAWTAGQTLAVYCGKATRSGITSINVSYAITTATVAPAWAELAIATGNLVPGNGPTLNVVGFVNSTANMSAINTYTTNVPVAAGQKITEGDELWVLIGSNVVGAYRSYVAVADDLATGMLAQAVLRPSLFLGNPTAFAVESTAALAGWVRINY